MIEVVRRRLDARARYRWHVALAQEPILADPAPPPARGPRLAAMTSAFVYVAMVLVILAEDAFAIGRGVLWALTLGGVALVGRRALWMWRDQRSRWPSGRFLFRWGYVEIEHDTLRYVPAGELTCAIEQTDLGVTGVSVRAGSWSAWFGVPADEDDDALGAALARVGEPQPALLVDGYRDAPWVVEGSRAHARLSPLARDAAWVLAAALLGAAAAPSLAAMTREVGRSAAHAGRGSEEGAFPTAHAPSRHVP